MLILTSRTLLGVLLFLGGFYSLAAQCTLVANANVNISMPPSCAYTVTPGDVLAAGSSCPGGNLVVEIRQGLVWVPANLNATHIGQTLSARVRDLNSGSTVSFSLTVEDKTPPQVINCPNLTISCEDACQSIPPPVFNDCSIITLAMNKVILSAPCSDPYTQVEIQIFTATDAYNNVSGCNRRIEYSRRSPAAVVFPPNITLQVTGTNCAPWCNNGAGRPSPTQASVGTGAFGSPLIDGSPVFPGIRTPGICDAPCVSDLCQLITNYTDATVTLCGTNRRIDRTWTVSAACGTPAFQTYLQRIWIFTDGNTTCGAACGTPFNLNQSYSSSTGLTTFNWSVPASTCVNRYDIQYRVKIGGVWQAWVTASPGTNSYQASLPVNVPAEWQVRSRCNGVNSVYSPVKSFVTNSFMGDDTEDRSEEQPVYSEMPPAPALEVYPSPNNGTMTFTFNEQVNDECEFVVTDLQGRLVYRTALMEGILSMDLELENQPGGIYVARVTHPDGKITVSRFVIVK